MNKIKENISLIFTILIICIVFWFGRSCGKAIIPKTNLEPNTDTFISHKVDTIWARDTVLKYALKLKYKHDTIIKPIYLDSTECNRVYVYEDTIRTKEYDLYRKSHVQGKLRYDTTGVKLKVPIMIKDCTVVKKDSLIFKPNKYEIHAGLVASPVSLYPIIEMSVDKNTFGIGYDPFNKIPYISYKFRIISWTPKKKNK